MNLKNNFWYFTSALTPRFCDEVIKYGNQQKELLALTGTQQKIKEKIKHIKRTPENQHLSDEELAIQNNIKINADLNKEELLDLKRKRDSNIVWLSERWIYKEIHPYIHTANKNAGWNFEWDFSEACQFTKYKLNQHYDWHCDSYEEPYDNSKDLNLYGKIRKLSVTCSLSNQKDYKGGELEFSFRNNFDNANATAECTQILPRGSIVVFPSFVWHRVKPVTEGTRYSLVIWNLGRPFK
jgi:PKHD-type hydroxylase